MTVANSSKLFLSYARLDGTGRAERLATELRACGFQVWMDTRDIGYHLDFTAEIENAISTCAALVFCLTRGTKGTKSFVRRELVYAQSVDVPIVVARFDSIPPPIQVATNTFVEFRDRAFEAAIKELVGGINNTVTASPVRCDHDAQRPPVAIYMRGLYGDIKNLLDRSVRSLISVRGESLADMQLRVLSQEFLLDHAPEPALKEDTLSEQIASNSRKIVVAGAPGSGKTTSLLMAARDQIVLNCTNESPLVPIVVRLAEWNPEHEVPLSEWLSKFHSGLDPSVITQLLREGKAYLFLDALDEIRSAPGDDVDRFRRRFLSRLDYEGPTLLTCRDGIFERVANEAHWDAVIRIRSLSAKEVRKALEGNEELLNALPSRPQLFALVATPLFCNLLAGASSQTLRRYFETDANDEELCFRLVDEYVSALVQREARKLRAPQLAYQATDFMDWIAMLDAGGGGNVNTFSYDDARLLSEVDITPLVSFAERCGLMSRVNEREFRFSTLVYRDHFAVRGGIAFLTHSDPDIRDRAAWALWQVPNRVAVSALLPVLSDSHKYARGSAISALGAIGDPRATEGIQRLTEDHTRVSSIYGNKISDVAKYWLKRIKGNSNNEEFLSD